MASPHFLGSAAPVADVWTLTPGGTILVGDTFTVTIGQKTVSYVATGTTVASVTAGLAAVLQALSTTDYPEFAEYGFADVSTAVVATASQAGVPGTMSVAITSVGGTFGAAHTTSGTGPSDWSNAANWDTGSVPAGGDDVTVENSTVPILYGLDQHTVSLNSLTVKASYTGTIGLPKRNASGYAEYRTQYLQIGATTVTIGDGPGGGSGRIKHNAGSVACTWNVYNAGTPAETGVESVLLLGTSASNVLNVTRGSVGVAVFAGEAANLSGILRVGYQTNQAADSKVRCGSGVTLANLVMDGGQVEINSNLTTVTVDGGTLTHKGASTITTLNNFGGTVIDQSSGTYTTVLNMGTFDRRQAISQQTITNLSLYAGSKTYIPTQTSAPQFGVTLTNPFQCVGCEIDELGALQLGPNKKYTFADI